MRGTNGPMDVITRAEFDHSMKDALTKTDFELRLADTKSELVSAMKQAVRENIADLKVDILDAVETKVTQARSLLALKSVSLDELTDAKNEILATTRRNIADAVAPLATKADMEVRFSKIDASHEAINKSIKDLTHFVTEGLGAHEHRLTDQEASS
jgi:hypothetical protein